MLAKYLKDLRAAKVVQSSQALSTLGAGWTQGENGAVQKEFVFDDFIQASNFMSRYADFCHKVNHAPEWSNVYNKVNVRLHNAEFNGMTEKELEIGQYLDTVSQATLNADIENVLSFDQVTQIAQVDVSALVNDQQEATSLFSLDAPRQAKTQPIRLLTQ